MKHLYIVIFFLVLLFSHRAQTQQLPQFSMYLWNNYLINPAIGGSDNSLDVKMGYRSQWVGLEGAPRSMYVTVHSQIGKRLQNDEDIDVSQNHGDHRPKSYVQQMFKYKKRQIARPPSNYKAHGHHGVGMQIMNDRIGPFNVTTMLVSYAYHLPLGKKVYASLGTYVGVRNYNLNTSFMSLTDVNDKAVGSTLSSMIPDGTLGGLVYGDKFYGGFAINQIMNYKLDLSDIQAAVQGRLARHYFVYGGYRIKMPNQDFAVVPSIMFRHLPNTKPSVDFNTKINYMDVLWFGFSYRHADSFIGMLGFHFNNHWDIGYSYDFTTSALNKYNNGTHEVVLGYRLINKKTTGCKPSYIW